jgi:DNA-binding NarL/FixJ family response regulator
MNKKLVALIVDDSQLIAERLIELLKRSENIQRTVLGSNYEEGKRLLEENAVDVILLDINLPDKSGIELLKHIKKIQYPVKVIMVTNESNPMYKQICMKLGAYAYFDKSNEFENLLEILETLGN